LKTFVALKNPQFENIYTKKHYITPWLVFAKSSDNKFKECIHKTQRFKRNKKVKQYMILILTCSEL